MEVVTKSDLVSIKESLNTISERELQNYEKISFLSFTDIMDVIDTLPENSYEMGRHVLYYLFQSVTDLMINYKIEEVRDIYDKILHYGVQYYSSYYKGNPDLEWIKVLTNYRERLRKYDDRYYFKKRVNFDSYQETYYNEVNTSSIANWLKNTLEIMDYTEFDVVVGIATSSAEMAMSLSGIINKPLFFIRYSKRRCDSNVSYISKDYEKEISGAVKGKAILVVDDMVQYGTSMETVSLALTPMNPVAIFQTSINHGFKEFTYDK